MSRSCRADYYGVLLLSKQYLLRILWILDGFGRDDSISAEADLFIIGSGWLPLQRIASSDEQAMVLHIKYVTTNLFSVSATYWVHAHSQIRGSGGPNRRRLQKSDLLDWSKRWPGHVVCMAPDALTSLSANHHLSPQRSLHRTLV